MLDPFILPAGTFPILGRTENPFAEKAAFFRLEGAVIDGFRVLYLTAAPSADCIRSGNGNVDLIETGFFRISSEKLTYI